MTKFIKYKPTSGVDYVQCQNQENHRFHIYRYSDGTEAYSNRRPRIDSKYRDVSKYLIWDNQRKCVADE